ncbi:MAG: hypothetical protein HY505_01565 [Candidatus Yanofskybacteria bacterium]|nr:hypothetical protein [Candidatus Yanofskybacteria bacterium]
MAIYKTTKIQRPTGVDYEEIGKSRPKIEKNIRDILINKAVQYKGPKDNFIIFDLGLRYDFNGNLGEDLIEIKCLFKEEYLRYLEDRDAIKSVDFLFTDDPAGSMWTAKIKIRPERTISYFKELSKNKIKFYVANDGNAYIDFGYGEQPKVLIAKKEDNQCMLLSVLFRSPGLSFSLESIYSEFSKGRRSLNAVRNAIKEIQRKLKNSGHGKTIKFVLNKPKNSSRYLCYMTLP